MTATVSTARKTGRKAGYVILAALNTAMLVAINVTPGWRSVDVLTPSTSEIIGWVNLVLAFGLAVNVLYSAYDPLWLLDLGDLATSALGLAALIQIWKVFPFDFSGWPGDWGQIARLVLIVAIVGTVIAIPLQVIGLVRHLAGTEEGK